MTVPFDLTARFDPAGDAETAAIPPPFNPSQCLYGYYPTIPHHHFPWASWSSTGNNVGYLNAVLHCIFNQGFLGLDIYGTHYTYRNPTTQAVRNVQNWAGIYVDGVCGTMTWNVIQWAAAGFPV